MVGRLIPSRVNDISDLGTFNLDASLLHRNSRVSSERVLVLVRQPYHLRLSIHRTVVIIPQMGDVAPGLCRDAKTTRSPF